jgi:HSP20 family protein
MRNLVRRDNSGHDLFDLRRDFDQMFNRFLGLPLGHQENAMMAGFAAPVESFIDKDDKKFHCRIMLPGVDPKDVNIQVQGNLLLISGERTDTREEDSKDFLHREITYGSFQRSITLPEGVDKEKISAEYRDGVLEITAPVASAALPKKIEIRTGTPAARHATA